MSPDARQAMDPGSVVILAGGSSRRIGTDKAFLELGGRTLLARVLEGPTAGFHDVVLVSNDRAAYTRFLLDRGWRSVAEGHPDRTGTDAGTFQRAGRRLQLLGDARPGSGPLAGLEVGLRAASHPYCWVLGCDYPLVHEEVGRRLLRDLAGAASSDRSGGKAADARGIGAVVPVLGKRLQTLCSAVRADAYRAAEGCLNEGFHRMTDLLDRIGYVRLDESHFADLGIPDRLFLNVNRPEDLGRAREWLERGDARGA